MQIMLCFGAPQPSVVAWVPRHLMHKYRRWYNVVYRSGGFKDNGNWRHCKKTRAKKLSWIVFGIVQLLNHLEAIKNRTYLVASFWWPLQWRNDASVTAEHHAWEFFNSLYVLLVRVSSRPANLRLSDGIGSKFHVYKLLSVSRGMLETSEFFVPSSISECYIWSFLDVQLSCEQFSSLFSFTTFTTHSSTVETGMKWWLRLCLPKIRFCIADK